MNISNAEPHRRHSIGEGRIALAGLLVVQAFLGYEWLMSGLTKVVRGGFASGLGGELRDKSEGAAGWYKSFVDGTVIPNSHVFGYLIIVGEIAIGVAFIVAAALWFWRWESLPRGGQIAVLAATALAALGAIFMNINFHLANGSAHPWLIPKDGFDEGVDLDSLLPFLQVVLLVISVKLLRSLRSEARSATAAATRASADSTPELTPAG